VAEELLSKCSWPTPFSCTWCVCKMQLVILFP